MKKSKLLRPRQWKGITYVWDKDVLKHHGQEFYDKFGKEMRGSTCPVIEKKGKEYHGAIYYWDYERFYNLIVKGIPTEFD
jgi:hypothetical protein